MVIGIMLLLSFDPIGALAFGIQFGLVAGVIFVLFCAWLILKPKKNKESTEPKSPAKPASLPDSVELSPSTKLMAGMLGATVLGKSSKKKEKSIFDSARDDLFWQEKYRRDNRYDECDDDDCDDCCDHEF